MTKDITFNFAAIEDAYGNIVAIYPYSDFPLYRLKKSYFISEISVARAIVCYPELILKDSLQTEKYFLP
jgi:hypothetical protein